MADMYTPEEIAQIFEAYNDAIQKNIPIGKDLAQQMKDATLGVKNYTQQLNQSLKQLGTSFKNLGSNIAKGDKGASVFNDALSSTAEHAAVVRWKRARGESCEGFAGRGGGDHTLLSIAGQDAAGAKSN